MKVSKCQEVSDTWELTPEIKPTNWGKNKKKPEMGAEHWNNQEGEGMQEGAHEDRCRQYCEYGS